MKTYQIEILRDWSTWYLNAQAFGAIFALAHGPGPNGRVAVYGMGCYNLYAFSRKMQRPGARVGHL